MLTLRFVRCWNGYDRGAEVPTHQTGLAEDLVRQGIAEIVNPLAKPAPVADARPDVKPKGKPRATGAVHS